jgi:DNA repair protein SbcC/Rad50
MRPHRLRVTAFGAFAGTEQVSFDDLEGLFLLHGETGAGKTTLLDAIAFALYGRVPGKRGETKRLRSDHAAASVRTEVELEATIGQRRLRITRKPEQERPKRSGTGMTREPASVRLEERSPEGDWAVKSARAGEADTEIKDLMGMSAEQFFQVVLLPQGQFAQFLHADAEARARLLQRLFGTDRFQAVEKWLADRRNETRHAVEAAENQVSLLAAQVAQAAGVTVPEADAAPARDELPWQLAWTAELSVNATAETGAAAAAVAARRRELDAALAAQREAEQLADRQRRRGEALRRQAGLEDVAPAVADLRAEADAAARAAEVAPVLAEADRLTAAASDARAAEERARAAVPPGETAAVSAAELRAAGEEAQAQLGRLDALRAVARQAADEDEAAAAARARATELEAALGDAEAATAQLLGARPQAARARDAASQAAAGSPAAQVAADTARRVATDSAALVQERAKRDRLREAHLTAREHALGLRDEALRVREARIDGMRAELAATLVDGTPCPVCGSLDHPELCELAGDPVSRAQEDETNAAADKASQAADEAGQQVAAADAVTGELTQRLTDAGFAVPDDAASLATAAGQAEDDAGQLEAHAAQLAEAAATLADLQRGLDALDGDIAAGKARLVELAEQRTAALAEATAAAQRAGDRRAELSAQLGGAPDLPTAIDIARRLAEALTAAADAADETARTAAEARDARDRAIRAALIAGFRPADETGDETGDRPGAETGRPADGAVGHDAVETARAAIRDAAWRREAAERISRHEAETEAVATLLADPELDVEPDPPAPVTERTEATKEAQQEHDAAVDAHGKARHTAGQLSVLEPQLAAALAALQPLKERADEARHLADLAAGLGANQYRMTLSSFVLAARLEEVAAAASERLLTMTAGRYSLVHTDARRGGGRAGLGLLACDSWTGVDRDTSTLSGGETFLASLALALGLADVVTAEAAGTPMEALFVDEGFGTLDEDTLEEVMNVLDGLREGGRIVGIVSHVTELRQRIPAQVHVRKGHHGSHVSVIVG